MIDQAAQLRRLVLRAALDGPLPEARPPRLIVVSGGRCGVGVTSLTVNLAVALAQQGTQAVLVDADMYQPAVAELCGLPPQAGVADVLAGRQDIHEVLRRGPAGVQVVPGCPGYGNAALFSESAQRRLLRQLRSLGRFAELVLIDAGSGGSEVTRRFWQAADQILLVAAAESQSVMRAYTSIKRVVNGTRRWPIQLIVNRASDREMAGRVHRRIDLCCRRFLGFGVGYLGTVPEDPQVSAAAASALPYLLRHPGGEAARQVEGLAGQILQIGRPSGVLAAASAAPAARDQGSKVASSTPDAPALRPIP